MSPEAQRELAMLEREEALRRATPLAVAAIVGLVLVAIFTGLEVRRYQAEADGASHYMSDTVRQQVREELREAMSSPVSACVRARTVGVDANTLRSEDVREIVRGCN